MKPRVLVTNVEERASLAACRGLASAGYEVVGAGSSRFAAGLCSRSCSVRRLMPDPRVDPSGFVVAFDEARRRHGVDVVIPAIDAALLALTEHGEVLDVHSALGAPRLEAVNSVLDKTLLGEAATAVGLAPPESVHCESEEALRRGARELGFPLMVKPTMSLVGPRAGRRQQAGVMAFDTTGLVAALARTGLPALLQRLETHSTVYSFGGVLAGGELIGSCLARYRRTWPPNAGSAAYAETIDVSSSLADRVCELLTTLGWEGVFELEFLGTDRPERTIDLNPRLYGSLALAISAGANLPALWCDWLLGRPITPAVARPGFRYRWEEAEARFMVSKLLHGELRDAAAVLRVRRRTVHAVFRSTDPLPLLADALRVPGRAASKARTLRRRPRDVPPSTLAAKELS